MCSQWVNKYSIMRDLSKVQGRVPVAVAGVVGSADRPPSFEIEEENEEEFYRNGTDEMGDAATPDLNLIKHMLDMVRDHDFPEEVKSEELLKITKSPLNAYGSEHHVSPVQLNHKKTRVERKSRNVAIASLLQKQESEESSQNMKDKLKLLKPEDVSEQISDSVEKVNGWLKTQEGKDKKTNVRTLNLEPSIMFKKKIVSKAKLPKTADKIKSDQKPQKVFNNFVPSSAAQEYYEQFQKKSKMKEMLDEDVWSKVESQMREIDLQRKQFAQFLEVTRPSSSSEMSDSSDFDDKKFDMIRLPYHRHLTTDQCVVCAVKLQNEVLGKVSFREEKINITENVNECDMKRKTACQELEDFIGDSA